MPYHSVLGPHKESLRKGDGRSVKTVLNEENRLDRGAVLMPSAVLSGS